MSIADSLYTSTFHSSVGGQIGFCPLKRMYCTYKNFIKLNFFAVLNIAAYFSSFPRNQAYKKDLTLYQ